MGRDPDEVPLPQRLFTIAAFSLFDRVGQSDEAGSIIRLQQKTEVGTI